MPLITIGSKCNGSLAPLQNLSNAIHSTLESHKPSPPARLTVRVHACFSASGVCSAQSQSKRDRFQQSRGRASSAQREIEWFLMKRSITSSYFLRRWMSLIGELFGGCCFCVFRSFKGYVGGFRDVMFCFEFRHILHAAAGACADNAAIGTASSHQLACCRWMGASVRKNYVAEVQCDCEWDLPSSYCSAEAAL